MLRGGAIAFIASFLFMGAGILVDREFDRRNYKPGESVKKSKREMINNMNDSTLNANIKTYNSMLLDYRVACAYAAKNTCGIIGCLKHNVHTPLRPNTDVKTVKDFYKHLKAFEANKIETRYKQLANQK